MLDGWCWARRHGRWLRHWRGMVSSWWPSWCSSGGLCWSRMRCSNGSWADGIVEWMIDWRDRWMSGCTTLEQCRG